MTTGNAMRYEFLGRTYLLGAVLSAFISLSFFNTVLVADEVFVVFSFGPELLAAPSKIVSWALSSSAGGWSTGRFISPLSHIISNTGVFLNEVTANVMSIDQIQAYSLWRIVMLVGITLTIMKLVNLLLAGAKVNQKTMFFVMSLASIVIPTGFVTNRAFSAIRMQTWSYGIFTALALWLVIGLITLAIQWQSESRLKTLRLALVSILALLFATTYELTQTLAPVALLGASYYFWLANAHEPVTIKKIKSAFLNKFNLIFLTFFSIPFLIIRVDSYTKCVSGCYQTASINPAGFSPFDFLGRTVSSVPPIAQTVGMGYESNWLDSGFNIAAFSSAFLLSLLGFVWLARIYRKTANIKKQNFQFEKIVILSIIGGAIVTVISLGMALSVAVQSSEEKLSFGVSSRDTLILSIGTSLFLIYFLSLSFAKLLQATSLNRSLIKLCKGILAVGISASFALTFVSNSIVTRATQNSAGAFMQSALANAVAHPDSTEQGNQVRCALVTEKIERFPEWEGHDRLLVNGLNQNFRTKVGSDFCAIPIEKLFENYPLK